MEFHKIFIFNLSSFFVTCFLLLQISWDEVASSIFIFLLHTPLSVTSPDPDLDLFDRIHRATKEYTYPMQIFQGKIVPTMKIHLHFVIMPHAKSVIKKMLSTDELQ